MPHDAVARATGGRFTRPPAGQVRRPMDASAESDRVAREDAALGVALDDLVAARSLVLLGGSEAELDAHDAQRQRLLSRRQRIRATLQRPSAHDDEDAVGPSGGGA